MDISGIYGDIFRACTIKSISYRVYALKHNTSQSRYDEFLSNGALMRAEVALRYESANVMTSLSQSGHELWVYLWEEEPEEPGLETNSSKDTEAAVKNSVPMDFLDAYGLETVAQGIFLPPFTGGNTGGFNLNRSISSNTLSNMSSMPATSADDRSRYGPLVRAIELKFLDSLLRNGDSQEYEAFGTKAAISTGDGSVIRLRPILHQDGSLVVRLTSQRAKLVPLPVNSIQMCAPLVWLLPHGKPCRILSSLRYEDVFEPPNPKMARSLYHILSSYVVTNVTLSQLESSMWIRVSSTETGGDLLWPIVLIRATPLTTNGYNLSFENSTVSAMHAGASALSDASRPEHSIHTGIGPSAFGRTGQSRPPISIPSTPGLRNTHSPLNHCSTYPSSTRLHSMTGAFVSPHGSSSGLRSNFQRDFNGLSHSPRRPLIKILKPSPYAALTEKMISVAQEIHQNRNGGAERQADQDLEIDKLHQTLNRPLAPPPSPRLNTAAPSMAPSLAPTAVATPAAMSPGGPAPSAATGHAHVYPTPTYHTPAFQQSAYGTPSASTPALPQDGWMDVDDDADNEEVGDADFNFFDLPLNGSSDIPNVPSRPLFKIEERPSDPEVSAMATDTPEYHTRSDCSNRSVKEEIDDQQHHAETNNNAQEAPRIRNFASLNLHSADLDSKYSSGGRFYAPPPPQDDEQMADGESESTDANKKTTPTVSNGVTFGVSEDEDSSDSDSDDMDFIDEDSGLGAEKTHAFLDVNTSNFDNEEAEKFWLRFMKQDDVKYLPIDQSKFLSFLQLLPQIVYDGGLLSEMYDAPVVSGQVTVAPEHVYRRLPWEMSHCTIGSTANDSGHIPTRSATATPVYGRSTSSNNTSSSSGSGGGGGSVIQASLHSPNAVSAGPTSASGSGAPQRKMQLLSPPLVALRRGEFSIRARVSILRFWRLLSLSPPLPETDTMHIQSSSMSKEYDPTQNKVVIVLITLASPAVVEGARRMLNGIKGAFEGCSLGVVDLPTFGSVEAGLLQIQADLGHTSGDAVGDLFLTACTQLKAQLQTMTEYDSTTNLLILMGYPPSSLRGGTLTAIVPFQLAQGFATIQAGFPESQWILSSLDSLVSRWNHDKQISEFELEKLALLAYARFPQFPQAFRLAGLVPNSLGLQFSMEMPQYLMEDEPVLHVSYLIVEGRWCLTSWSDQWARKTGIDVLKLADSSERSLQLVFSELLKRSDQISREIKDRPGWRFSVTKCGAMPISETNIWERIIQHPRKVILMDIPHPVGVMVADRRSARPARPTAHQDQAVSMPDTPLRGSTAAGLSSSLSPRSSSPLSDLGASNASCGDVAPPSPQKKMDGVIVDATDEIYGISVDAPKAGVSRYAEASALGYLIRPSVEGHVALETRLLHVFGLSSAPRIVMSRVIGQFRRLASLSEFMGVSTDSTLIPWHVMALAKLEAAALKLNML